jgi:hypothetical protein
MVKKTPTCANGKDDEQTSYRSLGASPRHGRPNSANRRRMPTRSGWFICNRTTVARPYAVMPSISKGRCSDHLRRHGIFPVDVGPLAGVAMRTRPRQIGHIRLSGPRSRQNMVNLKTTDLQLCRQVTVFTAVASASDHLVPYGVGEGAHPSGNRPGSAVRRRSMAAWASSFSNMRLWAKSTQASNSSCSP